jgi:hypothetical protein
MDKLLVSILLVFIFMQPGMAQTRTVTGTVADQKTW